MRIVWNALTDKTYESGLDRGVFYDQFRVGVPWNGLVSVSETKNNSVSPVYFDGDKVNDVYVAGSSSAKLEAYMFPDEFLPYIGVLEAGETGLFLTDQPPVENFHLSYRTLKTRGDDTKGYYIHIWYNLTAVMGDVDHATINDSPEAIVFNWDISSIPERTGSFAPTGHLIIDSTKMTPSQLEDVEKLLYGSETDPAKLPELSSLHAYVMKWRRMIITDNDDGTWTAEAHFDEEIEITGDTFTIYNANATYSDADTFEISSTVDNREDVWQP